MILTVEPFFNLLLLLLSHLSRVRLCATRWQPIRHPVPGNLQAGTLEWGAIAFSLLNLIPPNFQLSLVQARSTAIK